MLGVSLQTAGLTDWLVKLCYLGILLIGGKVIYNVWFHPLANIPGPFWCKISAIPSWLQAVGGRRHLWALQQFEIYGPRIRVAPNTVLFRDPGAHADIYNMKSNVHRGNFYVHFQATLDDPHTLNTESPALHAYRRKILNSVFTEKSVRSASEFVIQHVDRWNELILERTSSPTEWSDILDCPQWVGNLAFDIMGELSFGRSLDLKEPGDEISNPLKAMPGAIHEGIKALFIMFSHNPWGESLIFLRRYAGLDALLPLIKPQTVKDLDQFGRVSVEQRIDLYNAQVDMPESAQRHDMFHHLIAARHPTDPNKPALTKQQLIAEANLLIVAGSDTTATNLCCMLFYLTADPIRLRKLTREIRGKFASAEDVVMGPALMKECVYLRACLDEAMRLCPIIPGDLARTVLKGGQSIMGDWYPEGTWVGTVGWADSRDGNVWGEGPGEFIPERWIVEEGEEGPRKEEVAKMRKNFTPFTKGPTNCAGQNLAMVEMMIVLGRTLWRMDVRRAPGSTAGGGVGDIGQPDQFHFTDAYLAVPNGPELQFRKRADE